MPAIWIVTAFLLAWSAVACDSSNATALAQRTPGAPAGSLGYRACCDCLGQRKEVDLTTSCLRISADSCARGANFSAQCFCWEACFTECNATVYPYANEPDDCVALTPKPTSTTAR